MPAKKVVFSEEMGRYFRELNSKDEACYEIARKARARGKDPEIKIEIPRAEDLASRVEELLRDYNVGKVADTIRDLTEKFGNRELVSLKVAEAVAKEKISTMSKEMALDCAIRVGLAVLTEGILVAPLEGLADTRIGTNEDGSEYVDLIFAGPIRAAGGTAQAMSVLIADVVRTALGIGKYIPTEAEINRFVEEIPLYKQCQHIQYSPTEHEIQIIVGKCPVCIDGEGTEQMELSGFRDLPRIKTNQVRGGACLVVAEGMCLKATKLQKHVKKLGLQGWEFMDEYLAAKGAAVATKADEKRVCKPSDKYLLDLVAGRPIFGHPSRVGGFRLRYGRARTAGLASLAFQPATMYIMDEFMALGTQLKIERPGKACVVTPCDELDGPIVVLNNGNMVQCNTSEEAKAINKNVVEIVDNGEVLVPFGEFCENNHFLIPCGYPIEWHRLELEQKGELPEDWKQPTWERAKGMSKELGVPMHPYYNLFWYDMTVDSLKTLRSYIIENGSFEDTLVIPITPEIKRITEDLGALHIVKDKCMHIDTRYAVPMLECLALKAENGRIVATKEFGNVEFTEAEDNEGKKALRVVSDALGIEVRARAVTRIGMRMGRPEKAKDRKGAPIVHGLFPVGKAGNNKKDLIATSEEIGRNRGAPIEVTINRRECPVCHQITYRTFCRSCNAHTLLIKEEGFSNTMKIDVKTELAEAMATVKMTTPSEVKVMENLPSKLMVPEIFEKALLRKKHDLGVYKDGTIRYDMSDIPLTHFRPKEIGMTVQQALDLGYVHDMDGNPLTSDEQMCELKVQDVVPNVDCGDYMVRIANYIDDELEYIYGMDRFYNVKKRNDLIGQMGIGLAPHTSGGILCRIIGYTKACGAYAHPFFHASKRRNCDGDEDCIMLLMDGLLNFSRAYLPKSRGGFMDAPLVLTTRLDPNEIDKEAHNVDCLKHYPLEFYQAAMEMKDTKVIEDQMDLIAKRIGTEKQYEGLGFTHNTSDISDGPKHSAYSTLESMKDKMLAQLLLGKKLRAVDEKDVATKVIDKHFMPDMAGNLRSFSAQTVRCTKCGEKYRRIPLSGVCKCGNKLTLTVHEASVRKYVEVSKNVSEQYNLSDYTRERIMVLEMGMNSLFNSDKIKKPKLEEFF